MSIFFFTPIKSKSAASHFFWPIKWLDQLSNYWWVSLNYLAVMNAAATKESECIFVFTKLDSRAPDCLFSFYIFICFFSCSVNLSSHRRIEPMNMCYEWHSYNLLTTRANWSLVYMFVLSRREQYGGAVKIAINMANFRFICPLNTEFSELYTWIYHLLFNIPIHTRMHECACVHGCVRVARSCRTWAASEGQRDREREREWEMSSHRMTALQQSSIAVL